MASHNLPKTSTTGKEYADYLLQRYANVEPTIAATWKKVPFAKHPTYITPEGNVYSDTPYRPLKKLAISTWHKEQSGEQCVSVRTAKNKYKVSNQLSLHRLFFFCFIYPDIINKKLENMNMLDFIKMPYIKLRDGDPANFHLSNFVFCNRNTNNVKILHLYTQVRPEFRKHFNLSPTLKNFLEKKKQ